MIFNTLFYVHSILERVSNPIPQTDVASCMGYIFAIKKINSHAVIEVSKG